MTTNQPSNLAAPAVEEDAHLAAAAYVMKHDGAPALVVLDNEEGTRQVGMITEADVDEAKARRYGCRRDAGPRPDDE